MEFYHKINNYNELLKLLAHIEFFGGETRNCEIHLWKNGTYTYPRYVIMKEICDNVLNYGRSTTHKLESVTKINILKKVNFKFIS